MTEERARSDTSNAPAFYAEPRFLHRTRAREWWTVLHPPYTVWHLSYVVIGSCLVAPVNATRLIATLLAFFLAVGLGAHALDELHGRPLGTTIPASQLVAVSVVGIGGAVALGVMGCVIVGPALAAFIVVGVALAVGYNLELWHGRLHTDAVFALGWGSFPLLTAAFVQQESLNAAAFVAAAFAGLLSQAQRQLSTPARVVRRRTSYVEGELLGIDGTTTPLDATTILRPLESALRSLTWAVVALAVALVCARFL